MDHRADHLTDRTWLRSPEEETGDLRVGAGGPDEETSRQLHRTIVAVREGMESLRFNTSIARITELTNHLTATYTGGWVPLSVAEPLALLPRERRRAGPQDDEVADRQAVGDQQLLRELLVHARGAREHARTDVGHAGHLQQSLDRAVLPERPVQHGEDDVDAGEGRRDLLAG